MVFGGSVGETPILVTEHQERNMALDLLVQPENPRKLCYSKCLSGKSNERKVELGKYT